MTISNNLTSALVSVLPELVSETDPKEGMKQLGCIFLGIAVMFSLSFLWYLGVQHQGPVYIVKIYRFYFVRAFSNVLPHFFDRSHTVRCDNENYEIQIYIGL